MCEISDIEARASFAGAQARIKTLADDGKSPTEQDPKADASFHAARAEYLSIVLRDIFKSRVPKPACKYFGQELHCCPAFLGAAPIHLEYVAWTDGDERCADIIAVWIGGVRVPTVDGDGKDRFSKEQLNTWGAVAIEHRSDTIFGGAAHFSHPGRFAARALASHFTLAGAPARRVG
jgi:hypothetical protein